MKGFAILAAAAVTLTLAGCNRLGTSANGFGNAAAPKPAVGASADQTAPQTVDAGKLDEGGGAVPASGSGPVPLDRTYMTGRWTDDANCDKSVAFNQDGGYTDADGATGRWNLDGDRLTFTRNNSTVTFRIAPIDRNRMTVIHDDGSLEHSTRC